MKLSHFASIIVLGSCGLVACGSSRDVEVKGDVSASDGVAGDGAIRLEFYEPRAAEEGEAEELELVHSISLSQLGSFTEEVPLEGDRVHVIALIDRDGDEACTNGEPWGEAEVTITEEDTAEVSLSIAQSAACPQL